MVVVVVVVVLGEGRGVEPGLDPDIQLGNGIFPSTPRRIYA